MSEMKTNNIKIQGYLLKFDGITCPGCVTAIKKATSLLNTTNFIEISESNGDTLINSSLTTDQIRNELHEFEGCCSDCQISIREVVKTDKDSLTTLRVDQDKFELVKKQYKQALERALDGIEVACSENCVCKTTDIDRLSEADGAASFASVYNLSELLSPYLKKGMMVTDFGCGTGHDATRIAQIVKPGLVTGFDVTPEMVEFAEELSRQKLIENTKFMESHNLSPLESESQDLIYVNNVLNLLDDKYAFLKSAFEKLNANGLLIIADEFALEEFPTDLRNDEAFQCGGISGAEFVDNMESVSQKAGFQILIWELIKNYEIEFNNKQYKLKTAILILVKTLS